jgi:hypothetical protein
MCDAVTACGAFDPKLCPLLQNLSPDEQQERMSSDPRIANCIAMLGGQASGSAQDTSWLGTGAIVSSDLSTGEVDEMQYGLPEGIMPQDIGLTPARGSGSHARSEDFCLSGKLLRLHEARRRMAAARSWQRA